MPLFRALAASSSAKPRKTKMGTGRMKHQEMDENESVLPLTRMCLSSLVDNMKTVWVKDYEENYLDRYNFRHIMGPFNSLPGSLVEELICLLCSRKQLFRAALHLLLVPQLSGLSLQACPGLATPPICSIIAARCQCLSKLDLSGAQQVSAQVQANMLSSLPTLRFLSLAGTLCDERVIRTLVHRCLALRHLDVSRCHFLSPAALMPLGGGLFSCSACPSNTSSHSTSSPKPCSSSYSSSSRCALPLRALLAVDVGFGEDEGEAVAAAAYLLLALPSLERVAVEGLDLAFGVIHRREFGLTEKFARRAGVPCSKEVWRERWLRRAVNGKRRNKDDNVEERWEVVASESTEEDSGGEDDEQELSTVTQKNRRKGESGGTEKVKGGMTTELLGDDGLTLRLREVQTLSSASLEVLGQMCPHIRSISLNVDAEEDTGLWGRGSSLATGLRAWAGQLNRLTLHHPGPLVDLLPTLQGVGSTLTSLRLEGVKISPHSPLLEALQACPRLQELLFSAEPVPAPLDEREVLDDQNVLSLPHLCSLTLSFDHEHQLIPAMSWRALRRALSSLLSGSTRLERVSLTAVPCHLDILLHEIIFSVTWNPRPQHHSKAESSPLLSIPLRRVKHLSVARSDVTMATVERLVKGCKRMESLDLKGCWKMSLGEITRLQMSTAVRLAW